MAQIIIIEYWICQKECYMKTLTNDHKSHHCDNKYEFMIAIDIIVYYELDF